MDIVNVIVNLQALVVLVAFLLMLAVGFKVWRWNYVTPPR